MIFFGQKGNFFQNSKTTLFVDEENEKMNNDLSLGNISYSTSPAEEIQNGNTFFLQ